MAESTTTYEATQPLHCVLLIHGIRTQGDWQAMVRDVIAVDGEIEVIPVKYGYFDALKFWLPFWTRKKPIERVEAQLRVAIQKYRKADPHAKFSVIAHSFGTYVMGQILKENFDLKVHRLILCGAVLPSNFPWEQIQGRFDDDNAINECGKSDIWPVLAQSTTWGYGASGTHGFGSVLIKDRVHPGGHGQYFTREFVEQFWEPFVRRGEFKHTEFEVQAPTTPWWLSTLGLIPIRWLISLALVALLAIAAVFITSRFDNGSDLPVTPEEQARLERLDQIIAAWEERIEETSTDPATHSEVIKGHTELVELRGEARRNPSILSGDVLDVALVIGSDPNNPGPSAEHLGRNYTEYSYTTMLAPKIAAELDRRGIRNSIFYRNGSRDFVSGIVAASSYDPELIVELHTNTYSDPDPHGAEVLVREGDELAKKIGAEILDSLHTSLGIQKRRVGPPQFGRGTKNVRIAPNSTILVLPFFISNPNDLSIAIENTDQLAKAIATPIADNMEQNKSQ